MTSSRRAAFFALFLVPSAVVFGVACGQGSNNPPPPTYVPPVDSGPRVVDSGHMDTFVPDTFVPDTNVADTFEASIDACEASPSDGGDVIVTPSSIEFGNMGFVPCGTQAMPQIVSITNTTCTPFMFMSTVTGMGGYMLSPATAMVMPGATQIVQVTPAVIPQTSAVTADLYQGTLTITTTAPGDTGHIIALHETAYGVILASTAGGAIAFGSVNKGQMPTSQYNVSNTGNESTTVSFAVGSPAFTVTPSFPLASMASNVVTVTFLPTNLQSYTDQVTTTLPAGTAVCGPIPAPIQLTGTGTPVPTGVTVMPATLNFADVNCGAQAPLQTLTLNTSNVGASATYTATFGMGNKYYTLAAYNSGSPLTPGAPIATGTALPLPAMGSLMIDVVPNAIPGTSATTMGGFNDTLTITTNVPMDTTHMIQLQETAQGAILTFTPTMIMTTSSPGTATTPMISVVNVGNLAANFTLSLGAESPVNAPPAFSLNDADGGLVAGSAGAQGSPTAMFAAPLEFNPPQLMGATTEGGAGTTFQTIGSMHLTPAAGAVLCSPPPTDAQLFGTN
jgi:hypothetical protein